MMTAAKRLIALGQEDGKQNWVNTYIQGRRLRADVVENESMFQFLTRDHTAPVLELDYCGVDFVELCVLWENRRNESDRRVWVEALLDAVQPHRCIPPVGVCVPHTHWAKPELLGGFSWYRTPPSQYRILCSPGATPGFPRPG
jgi:hypothetical protein